MGNRRFVQIYISDDDDDDDDGLLISQLCRGSNNGVEKRECKPTILCKEEEEEEEEEDRCNQNNKRKAVEHLEEEVGKEKKNRTSETKKSADESEPEEAKPIGDVIRVSGKGRARRNHYKSFEYNGQTYELEDPVLLAPEEQNQKPYVAIIKGISQTWKGNMMVEGQWFYWPEEAEKETGGNWQSRDIRELFYSFHRDEVSAHSVMHKCVVHFIPLNKQIPKRKQHPGFIVQKVYDTEQRRLFNLTDKDYEDRKQHEIDLLVQKTISLIGDLPDIEHEDHPSIIANEDQLLKSKQLLRKQSIHLLDVSREDEAPGRNKAETPGSSASNASEYSAILKGFNVMMNADHRNRWLEKLLQAIQFMCSPSDGNERGTSDGRDPTVPAKTSSSKVNEDNYSNGEKNFHWPDSVVPVIVSLERAVHDALASDFQKYNQKMRQLVFSLKNNARLARRLLNGELHASQVLSMTPTDLKEGLTSDELASRLPEEKEPVQIIDARCKQCGEKQVSQIDITQAGHGDHYQMTDKGKGKKQNGSKTSSFFSSPTDTLRLLRQSVMSRSRDDTEAGCSNPSGNMPSADLDASLSPTTTSHNPLHSGSPTVVSESHSQSSDSEQEQNVVTEREEEENEVLDPLLRDQHVYVDPNGEVKITTAACHLITPSFYLRGDPEGTTWKNVGPETRDFYWREFQKHCTWDRRIPTDMVKKAFMRRASRLYSRFTYNHRAARVVHKKPPTEIIGRWDEMWNTPSFKQKSELKKKNRRKGKDEGPALGTYTGGSIPFSQHLNQLTESSQAPIVDAFKHTKTKKHDGQTWLNPEDAQLQDNFFHLKQMSEAEGIKVSDEEIWYELVGGFNQKNKVKGVGDLSEQMKPLKNMTQRRRKSTSDVGEIERLKAENALMKARIEKLELSFAG